MAVLANLSRDRHETATRQLRVGAGSAPQRGQRAAKCAGRRPRRKLPSLTAALHPGTRPRTRRALQRDAVGCYAGLSNTLWTGVR